MFELEAKEFIPAGALQLIESWLPKTGVKIVVKNGRKSKLGDYRRLLNGHQITINGDLNQDFFLFTLTHEIAHLRAFVKYGYKIKPHGKEWKHEFREMLNESISFYSPSFAKEVVRFKKNPKASLFSDHGIAKAYMETKGNGKPVLDDLKEKTIFRIGNRIFKKGEKRKIRYLCADLSNGKKYWVNGLAPVDEILN